GIILAASIVGSGELIATTTLGAQVGYTALWIILLSCLIKPVVQAELGRYTIASGETGLEGLNRVPGPSLASELDRHGLVLDAASHIAPSRSNVWWNRSGHEPARSRRLL